MSDHETNTTNTESTGALPPQDVPYAIVSLILGILSIPLACCLSGIPGLISAIIALVLAHKGNQAYLAEPETYSENSYRNLKIGKVFAYIGLALSLLLMIFVIYMLTTGQFEQMMQDLEQFMENEY